MQKSRGLIWLAATAYHAMTEEASSAFPNETGGVILGYWSHGEAVITRAIGPGPLAKHGSRNFLPDHEYQSREIEFHYRESGRLHTYLGDWHTHPGGVSHLSKKDRRTLWTIANHPEARADVPLMAILSPGPDWQLKVWKYRPPLFRGLRFPNREVEIDVRFFQSPGDDGPC